MIPLTHKPIKNQRFAREYVSHFKISKQSVGIFGFLVVARQSLL